MSERLHHRKAYSQPASQLPGTQTFVTQTNVKDLPGNTGKPSSKNWSTRPDAPENKEQARPIAPDHRPSRDREKGNKTVGQPSYNTPPDSSKAKDTNSKPLHQRTRTLSTPGEEYGHPYMDQGYRLKQRRPDIKYAGDDIEAGYAPGSPIIPIRRQRKQMSKSKQYARQYYRRHKGRLLSKARRRYRTLKNNSRFKQYRKKLRKFPARFQRRPGGYTEPKDRVKEWREKNRKEADFYMSRVSPADLSQTWQRKNDKGTPDGPNQHSEVPDGGTTWVTPGANQREHKTPAHAPQDYVVDNNPGSAKVIPEGHGFVNRMANRVASRFLVATKIAEIETKTSPDILKKSKGLGITLARVDAANRIWLFDVKGSEPKPYRVRIRAVEPQGNVKRMDKVDVQISCSCPFWRWQGPEHWAKQNDYLYGKPVGTAAKPSVKDPENRHWMCKHVAAVLAKVKTYDVLQPKGKTASDMRYLSSSLRLAGL